MELVIALPLAIFALTGHPIAPGGPSPLLTRSSACGDAPRDEFSWWPGVWNYSTPGFDPAVSTVTASPDGCTLTEEFVDIHQQRQHTTIRYDATERRWKRVVADPFRTYASTGVFAPDGSISFYETPTDRETYRPADGDHVHFIGEKSTDGGHTWRVLFDATYARQQSPSTVTFIATQGKDTVSFEQFTRTGNTITGVWIPNNGQVQVHDYVLTLDSAGQPVRYDMAVSFPDGAGHLPPTEAKYILEFGTDSLTLTTGRTKPLTRRMAMKRGTYPAVGWSVLDRELRLTHLRAVHADTGDFAFTQISGGRAAPAEVVPVRFVGDSAIVGTTHYKVDAAGHILGWLLDSGVEARRVPPMDAKKYEDGLIAADAQAEAAARAKLITLPAAALDRLVGEYVLNANVTLVVARDSNTLTIKTGPRPAAELLAHSATLFSIGRALSGQMIEFETDSTGTATALTILAPGGLKQRVPKTVK